MTVAAGVRAGVRAAGGQARASLAIDSTAFMASLRRALDALEVQTEGDLWRLALRIQSNARILAPVDTGRLRSSITATKVSPTTVTIGTNVTYAAHVEFGTRYQAAQPYLRPALSVGAAQWAAGAVTGSQGGLA